MELKSGPIGVEGSYDVKIEGGKVKLVALYDSKGAGAKVEVEIDSDYFMDKMAAAIPGSVDDAVIGIIKVALKAA